MFRRRTLGLAAALGAVALFGGCAAPAGDEATRPAAVALADLEPIVLTLADLDSGAGAGLRALQSWMAEVTEKTEGKVTFESFYGGSLIPAPELVSGLSSGLADIGFVSPSISPDQLPVGNWNVQIDSAVVPPGFPGGMLTGDIANAGRTYGPGPVRDELKSLNLVPLAATMFAMPGPLMCNSKVVSTLDEAAGVSVRVGGQPWVDEVAALGMSGVNLPFSEVYEAVQRGVVDCVLTFPTVFLTSGIMDIATTLMLIESGPSTASLYAFNKDSWDALPLVVQQIMWDAIPTAHMEAMRNILETYREFIEVAQENETEIVYPAELNEVLSEHRSDLRESLRGLAPADVPDPDGYLADLEATVADGSDFVRGELGISSDGAASIDDVLAAYRNGSEAIDWELYREYIEALLAPYRLE